jgi:hypothetical protein
METSTGSLEGLLLGLVSFTMLGGFVTLVTASF